MRVIPDGTCIDESAIHGKALTFSEIVDQLSPAASGRDAEYVKTDYVIGHALGSDRVKLCGHLCTNIVRPAAERQVCCRCNPSVKNISLCPICRLSSRNEKNK